MEDAAATSAKTTVDLAASTLAELLRRYCGDLVTGLHLVGSVALGDFRPGRSDLDFVAVLSRRPGDADIHALAILHRSYGTDPTFPKLGGIWITEADLAAGPDATPDGPSSQDNDFLASDRGNRNPVTWFELRRAISVIGTLDRDALWHDRDRLVGWVRENACSAFPANTTPSQPARSPRNPPLAAGLSTPSRASIAGSARKLSLTAGAPPRFMPTPWRAGAMPWRSWRWR